MSSPLLALCAGLAAAAAGLPICQAEPVAAAVWGTIMPLGVALALLEHDVLDLARNGGQVLLAFLLGAAGMVLGACAAWGAGFSGALGPHGAALASCLLASYVGGSVNFASVAVATQLPPALLPPAMAADNLAMLLLLAAMAAVPVRAAGSLAAASAAAQPQQALEGAAQASSVTAVKPRSSSGDGSALKASHSSRTAGGGRLGLDGQLLETALPSPASVAACLEQTARGKARSSSSSSSGAAHMMQGKRSSHRAIGQLGLDASPLLTPDPTPGGFASSSSGNSAAQAAVAVGSMATASEAAAACAGGAAGSSAQTLSACGGCRASGLTALDHTPLLTRAPDMGDAVATISAARQGNTQVITPEAPGAPGSSATAAPSRPAAPAAEGPGAAPGCGCCEEALAAVAAASPPPRAVGGTRASGALALDGRALLTEEPDAGRLAASLAAAKGGSRAAPITVSNSLGSSDSSDDELELLMTLDIAAIRARLEAQQAQEFARRSGPQQSAAASQPAAPAPSAAAGAAAGGGLTSSSAAASLAAAALAAAASQAIATALGAPSLHLLALSGCALALSVAGNAAAKALRRSAGAPSPFAGAETLSQLAMGLFFATLGASCLCPLASLASAAPLAAFVLLMAAGHGAFLAAAGAALRLPRDVLLAGSAACVGGPATAAALMSAKAPRLAQPALLCGSLGYALGTGAGLLLATGLGALPG